MHLHQQQMQRTRGGGGGATRPASSGHHTPLHLHSPLHARQRTLLTGSSRAGRACTALSHATSTADTTSISSTNSSLEIGAPTPTNGAAAAIQDDVWTRVWAPASPLSMLSKYKPNKLVLLGRELVAWWQEGTQTWEVLEDRCPHRFAPLSLGRIVDDKLMCSYHGWSFSTGGACAGIPQLPPGQASVACRDKKACVASFPAAVCDGLLYVWLDNTADGLLASLQHKPYLSSAPSTFEWICVESPNDYTFWLEQGMDPSHAPFLHHSIGGFQMKNAIPMESMTVPEVQRDGGFVWRHVGYETRNQGMSASRQFIPPFTMEIRYNKPSKGGAPSTQAFTTMTVPVRPGVARTFFRFAASTPPASRPSPAAPSAPAPAAAAPAAPAPAPAPALAQAPKQPEKKGEGRGPGLMGLLLKASGKLPHWVFMNMELSDQDAIIMNQQEVRIRKGGLKPTNYFLVSPGADNGVAAINRWIRQAGPPSPLWTLPRTSLEDLTETPLTKLLDRGPRHVDFCETCQKGLRQVTFAINALAALAAACVLAAALGAARGAGLPSIAVAAALAVALGVATSKLEDFRETRFISGLRSWRKKGGLSLVGEK